MPTYGYRCGSCGHEFEIRQRITEPALTTCPKCGGKLAKMVYPAGVIFTGSGYYTTDYKGSGKDGGASSNGVAPTAEGSSESKPETKSESKSETKSEAKAEPKSKSSETKSESKSGSTDKKGS